MNREVISGKQLKNLIIIFLMGSALVSGGSHYAKHCAWISGNVSIILTIPIVLMYARLICIGNGKDIFDLFQDTFGKFIGYIFIFIFLIYTFYLGSAVIRNFSEFTQIVFFPETPQYVTIILSFVVVLYIINKGLETLARSVSAVIYGILAILLILVFLSIKDMDFTNIFPLFGEDIKTMAKESLFLLTLPYMETVMFLGVAGNVKKGDNLYKSFVYAVITSGVFLNLAYFRNLFVIGAHVMEKVYFPAYTSTSLINIADFITRIEVVASATYTFSIIIQSSICLITTCKGIAKLTNIQDYKVLASPVCLMALYLSRAMFKSTQTLFAAIIKNRPYIFFVQLIIPLITWIVAEIKYTRKKGASKT